VSGVPFSPTPTPGEVGINGSHLHSAPITIPQAQAAVKLHRVFSPRWRSLDCSLGYVASPDARQGQWGPR
jgi:predicted methyltransferase